LQLPKKKLVSNHTSSMSVYTWGRGDQGQLGCGEMKDLFHLDPLLLEGRMGAVVRLACGDFHCLAVNEFGDVYAWGRGRSGQLGDGTRKPVQKTPQKIEALDQERITDVACGSHHCLAVTQEGKVFQWGACHRFQGSTPNFAEKVAMPGMGEWNERKLKLIEGSHALYYATQCPTADAGNEVTYLSPEVANFGAFVSKDDLFPLQVPGLEHEKIISVSAGYSFSLAVAESGHLYSWGFNEKRQLGLLHRFNQETPVLVSTLAGLGVKIVKACCGQQHVIAMSSDGAVYSWGLGVLGQLGHGDCVDSGLPRPIQYFEGHTVVDIACGSHHSVVVTSAGQVFTFGSSEYGQLGGETDAEDWQTAYSHLHGARSYLGATPKPLPFDFDGLKVVKVSCGDLHSIVLCATGEIYTFGWGLNGALGHGDRRFQHFPRLVAKLKGEKILCVDASSHSTIVATASCVSLFAGDFKTLINNPLYSDLTFVIQNKTIAAHKAIVYPRCSALRTLCESRLTPENNQIIIDDEDFHIFNALIKYMYCDLLPGVPLHHIPKLKKLAFKYSLPHLIYICNRMSFNGSIGGNPTVEVVPSTFALDLSLALQKGNCFSDIQLVLPDGNSVYAHKAVLAARSDYFKTLFEGSFQEGKNPTLHLGEIDLPTLRAVLNYIYTNRITLQLNGSGIVDDTEFAISSDSIVDVLMASGRFLLSGLRQRIERELELNLNLDIVTDLLLVSEIAQSPKLKKACLQMIGKNQDQLKALPEYAQFTKVASPTLMSELDQIFSKMSVTCQ